MQPQLKTRIKDLEFNTPIVCASGTFGFGTELEGLADFKSIGAITTKTITVNPRPGNPPPRIYDAGFGILNSVGLENPGLEVFLKEKLPAVKKLPVKVIASVGGFCDEDYLTLVDALDKRNELHAIEVNLSCPNLQLKKLISQSAQLTFELTRKIRPLTKKPLFVKITPEVNDIAEIATAVQEAGADALTLVNTFLGMAINPQTQKTVLGNNYGGYSGPGIKPVALYRVWKAAQKISIPVIGGGGIETADDAIEFLLAGASMVSLGTVNMVDPDASKNITRGIKEYLTAKKAGSVTDIVGKVICLS